MIHGNAFNVVDRKYAPKRKKNKAEKSVRR